MSQQQRAKDTRRHLIDAAGRLFGERGYDATGVADICDAAGVSKGAFYHHFESKQALFLALLDGWLAELDLQLGQALAGAATFVDGLTEMAARLRPVFEAGRDQLPILFEFWLRARRDPAVWQAAIQPYHRYHVWIETMIRRAVARGEIRRVDAGVAAQVLMSLMVGLLLQGMLDPEGANWPRVTQDSLRLFAQGLQKK